MTDSSADAQTLLLRRWAAAVSEELAKRGATDVSIAASDVDIDAVLALAGLAAHAVVRPAAPLTTYLVGYATGLAVAAGGNPTDSFTAAAEATAAVAASWPTTPAETVTGEQ